MQLGDPIFRRSFAVKSLFLNILAQMGGGKPRLPRNLRSGLGTNRGKREPAVQAIF